MLARTADNLFWVSRYLERADFLARLIEASQPHRRPAENLCGRPGRMDQRADRLRRRRNLLRPFRRGRTRPMSSLISPSMPRNPSSIRNCIEFARTNARAVRTALTTEMWEHINSAWLKLKHSRARPARQGARPRSACPLSSISSRRRRSLYDGYAYRTMLRNDVYYFSRLGVCLERADNTARILDVKYHLLLPEHRGGRRLGRLFPMERHPARGFGGHRLSLGLSREHQALECRRSLDPAAGNAALADRPATTMWCAGSTRIGNQYGRHGAAQRQARAIKRKLESAADQGHLPVRPA